MTENKIKIFLVDDDSFLLDMYVIKFKSHDCVIETASNGQIALDRLRAGYDPDIILLDIVIPVMDGLELLKTIRTEKIAPLATVIMLTNEPDELEHAQALGVDGYIVKATTIPSEVVDQVLTIHKKNKKR